MLDFPSAHFQILPLLHYTLKNSVCSSLKAVAAVQPDIYLGTIQSSQDAFHGVQAVVLANEIRVPVQLWLEALPSQQSLFYQ